MTLTNEQLALQIAASKDNSVSRILPEAERYYEWLQGKTHPDTHAKEEKLEDPRREDWTARLAFMHQARSVTPEVLQVFVSAVNTGNYETARGLWKRAGGREGTQ